MSPVLRSTQTSRRSHGLPSAASVQDVTNTLSPQTTGDECPVPGISAFQVTFSVVDQRVGKPFSGLTPSPRGPRQPGQLPAGSAAAAGTAKIKARRRRDMTARRGRGRVLVLKHPPARRGTGNPRRRTSTHAIDDRGRAAYHKPSYPPPGAAPHAAPCPCSRPSRSPSPWPRPAASATSRSRPPPSSRPRRTRRRPRTASRPTRPPSRSGRRCPRRRSTAPSRARSRSSPACRAPGRPRGRPTPSSTASSWPSTRSATRSAASPSSTTTSTTPPPPPASGTPTKEAANAKQAVADPDVMAYIGTVQLGGGQDQHGAS